MNQNKSQTARLEGTKKLLCREIEAATSAVDLARRLWEVAHLECRCHNLSEMCGLMPVLGVFQSHPSGKLYYKQLDPINASEWSEPEYMGVKEVETSLAQFTDEELSMVRYNMWCLRDDARDREFGRQYITLADPIWFRGEYSDVEIWDAIRRDLNQNNAR